MAKLLDEMTLVGMGFRHIPREENPFQYVEMSYYVKDSVLLFYNDGELNKNSFLIGYGEMRNGVYFAVTFRWIKEVNELWDIYKVLTNKDPLRYL